MRNNNHEQPVPTRGKIMGIIPLFIGTILVVVTFMSKLPKIDPDPVMMGIGALLFTGGLLILIFAWDE